MKSMKVCCFIDSLGSGGAQRQLVNLAILLKGKGHEITFVIYRNDLFYKHYLDDAGIEVTYLLNTSNVERILAVRKYLRSYHGDVVISFLETSNFLACIAAIGRHKWRLITNELSAKEESFHGRKSKIYKWVERFSDLTVCNSQHAADMWADYYPQYKSKLRTFYNPIIIPEMEDSSKKVDSRRRRLVVAASYQYLKNPVRVVEAIGTLNDAEKAALKVDWFGRREVETGNSKAYNEAYALIQKKGLQNTIELHDETTDIYTEMMQADAVGLFSTVEGLPNAICEGMMLGRPIIMTRVSDYTNFVLPENGILCNPDTPSIAQTLKTFLTLPDEKLQKMGQESMKLAKKLFDKESIVLQWQDVLDQLLKNGGNT